MKLRMLLILSLLSIVISGKGQSYYYDNVLTYYTNTTPTNGVKIKTNLPFTPFSQMPTIIIEGYSYGTGEPINLMLNYYIYGGAFINSRVSTSGSANPPITLAEEYGKVVIFVGSKAFFQRFHIKVFAGGNGEPSTWFQNWTAVDSLLSGNATAVYQIPYQNKFAGNVSMPGNGIWNQNGNVGIGTNAPGTYKLAVEGTIGARKLQVKQTSWADFVFKPEYHLPSLVETENYIQTNGHLEGIPSSVEVAKEGVDVGEMNKLLLQKIEELTLHMIQMNKEIERLKSAK